MRALTRPEGMDAVERVHVSGAEEAGRRGSRNQVLNWCSGFVPWIWEMVKGGFVPNWCARAACESTSVSVVEFGVEAAVRRASAIWFAAAGAAGGWGSGVASFEVGAISPGATLGIGVLA
jgi:hypothetical protein